MLLLRPFSRHPAPLHKDGERLNGMQRQKRCGESSMTILGLEVKVLLYTHLWMLIKVQRGGESLRVWGSGILELIIGRIDQSNLAIHLV
jgi:hypothetical protein